MKIPQLWQPITHACSIATLLSAGMLDEASPAAGAGPPQGTRGEIAPAVVSAASLRSTVMCGYQGWFRCPGDAANLGWVHWSRNAKRISPETLTFEMWPDVRELGSDERFAAPGFTHPDGAPADLFSSDKTATVRRHFEWMRDCGLDGAWLQRFVVGLPGAPAEQMFLSNWRVLQHVREAAQQTGRVRAISYDIAAMPTERIYDTLTRDWKKLMKAPRSLKSPARRPRRAISSVTRDGQAIGTCGSSAKAAGG